MRLYHIELFFLLFNYYVVLIVGFLFNRGLMILYHLNSDQSTILGFLFSPSGVGYGVFRL